MDDMDNRIAQLQDLTPRERQVLSLLCERHGNYEQIGRILSVSERTVLFHVANIYEKLGFTDLDRAGRQRALALYAPLLPQLQETTEVIHDPLAVTNDPEPQPEPYPPTEMALAIAREDEPAADPGLLTTRTTSVDVSTHVPAQPVLGTPVVEEVVVHRSPLMPLVLVLAGLLIGAAIVAFLFLSSSREQAPRVAVVAATSTVVSSATPQPTTATPAPTATPVAPTATPVPPTSTPVPPTPSPAPTPIPATGAGALLRFGETWVGNEGLRLAADRPPYQECVRATDGVNCHQLPVVSFTLENRGTETFNFEASTNQFYLETNTGQRIQGVRALTPSDNRPSPGSVQFADFGPGKRQQFTMPFAINWNDFQNMKLNPAVTSYTVGVNDLNTRLPVARWQEPVPH